MDFVLLKAIGTLSRLTPELPEASVVDELMSIERERVAIAGELLLTTSLHLR
jgi:hypothetical protein